MSWFTMKTNFHAALAKTMKKILPSTFRASFLYPWWVENRVSAAFISNCGSRHFYLTKCQLLTFKGKKYLSSVNEKFVNTKECCGANIDHDVLQLSVP